MAVQVHSAALVGVDAVPITVEVDLLRRLPGVCVVGLAAGAVRESAERVRSAIVASGLEFPRKRVVINLAPAGLRKDGTALDLPIALGILAAEGDVPESALADLVIVGELSLAGRTRTVRGAVALAHLARKHGKAIVLPAEAAAQASSVPDVTVLAAEDLAGVIAHLRGERPLGTAHRTPIPSRAATVDLADVRGQLLARRALEVAAAGSHHLMMVGPPGCGKSMLARRLPTILPTLREDEALDVTRVHSAAGLLPPDAGLVRERPFRAPHHSVTVAGMIGDRTLRPGEVSLAHHGVLFLDEAPEFSRAAIEVLRAPLEDGLVQLTRAEGTVLYPAQLALVLAANPCPCGMRGSATACRCADADVIRYRRKLSGPILDRIDLHVELAPVPAEQILGGPPGESSAAVRARVVAARAVQLARQQRTYNAHLDRGELDAVLDATSDALALLHDAVRTLGLSGRATTRTLKVARTLADLEAGVRVDVPHIAEALGFRPAVPVD